MNRSRKVLILAAFAVAFVAPAGRAFALGDPPDTYFDPVDDVGCWKWNWYQHANYNVCPVYLHPKAYMYPRRMHGVVRVKG